METPTNLPSALVKSRGEKLAHSLPQTHTLWPSQSQSIALVAPDSLSHRGKSPSPLLPYPHGLDSASGQSLSSCSALTF